MADGKIVKMEVDYSSNVDELLAKVKERIKSGKFDGVLEDISSLEKQARMDSDAISTGRLLEAIVEILGDSADWDTLCRQLEIMSKKRNQLKQAVTKMVQKAMLYLDKTPNEETKLNLICSLRKVTEGKIYVEVERARLTMELVKIKETHNLIEEAATALQELQVETFGSMERREKVQFLLEQMRLSLARKDYIRTQITSKKISPKFFESSDQDDLKLKFYELMIQLHSHDDSYLDISKDYWEIYSTKCIQEDDEKKLMALKHSIAYLCLSRYDNEQHDLMHRRKILKDVEKIPSYMELLNLLTTQSLLRWNEICTQFESTLRSELDLFSSEKYSNAEKRWDDFRSRVVEHNIRVIAAYYTRIKLQRMADLLDLKLDDSEKYLSEQVVNKTVYAKIDRLEGVVYFTETKAPIEILEDWSFNTNKLMALINQTNHLINKERMIHAV